MNIAELPKAQQRTRIEMKIMLLLGLLLRIYKSRQNPEIRLRTIAMKYMPKGTGIMKKVRKR